jgi:Zn-dependent protease with chaperone function
LAFDRKLRARRERGLFMLAVAFSSLVWAVLVVSLVGLAYGLAIGLGIFVAHALFLAHVRGNGVRISERQLPELHARVAAAAQKLGLDRTPEVYVVQAGGALNAFATKLLSRRFVVLYSDLVDQCQDPRQLDFVVGHEVGHLAAGHLRWSWLVAPFLLVPWLGTAYLRAREYTADRCGLLVAGDVEQSMRGLVVLAGGGKIAASANLAAFMAQIRETGGFWMAVLELSATHPYLCKRAVALAAVSNPQAVPAPVGRHPLAWLLAPVLGAASGGPAAAPLMLVAIIGILAAIAVPNFMKYQERARATARGAAPAAAAAQVSVDPGPSGALTAEDRDSLNWVRQVRLQIAAKERAQASQSTQP